MFGDQFLISDDRIKALNCVMFSLKVAFEELVLRRRNASPLIKPFLTPGGWQDVKCVYWKVSVG